MISSDMLRDALGVLGVAWRRWDSHDFFGYASRRIGDSGRGIGGLHEH